MDGTSAIFLKISLFSYGATILYSLEVDLTL